MKAAMKSPARSDGDPRRPYRRSMQGWWKRDRWFASYMLREATALVVAGYGFFLLWGLVSLARGEAAWNAWLAMLGSPLSIAWHVLAFAGMAYHAWSWFDIMPKTLPPVVIGGRRVSGPAITCTGILVAIACAAAIVVFFWRLQS